MFRADVDVVVRVYISYYEVASLELETRARRTGRETSDCNSLLTLAI